MTAFYELLTREADTVAVTCILTLVASVLTVAISIPLGAVIAFRASNRLRYLAILTLLFVPFAVGSGVWAYAIEGIASMTGLKNSLVLGSSSLRASALLIATLARTLPLGAFFCATSLHRHTFQVRPYFRVHELDSRLFVLASIHRTPRSMIMLLGLFGGSLMASEAALPVFLYRANPGTPPETTNVMLLRTFREIYGSAAPEALSRVAALGCVVALLSLAAALLGAVLARALLRLMARSLRGIRPIQPSNSTGQLYRLGVVVTVAPAVLALLALGARAIANPFASSSLSDRLLLYCPSVAIGASVGVLLAVSCLAFAVALRYRCPARLASFDRSFLVASLLMLPAFLPALTLVALLTAALRQYPEFAGIMGISLAHFALHYPVFQFIVITIVAAIPEHHVEWQRAMRMKYAFSLINDGLRRNRFTLLALVGLAMSLVLTDGTIARWFAHIIPAPDEALYGAVFGRAASVSESVAISLSIAALATLVAAALAVNYSRELRMGPDA